MATRREAAQQAVECVAERIGFEARIAEAYTALEAVLEDEERQRFQFAAEEADLPYKMPEDQYDGATEKGAEQTGLSICEERTAEDKVANPIARSGSGVRRF